MTTVVLGHEPVVEAWLEQRRTLGQDGRDEIWDGVYHAAPHEPGRNGAVASELVLTLAPAARAAGLRAGGSFNLGRKGDFRVPDLGFHRGSPDHLYFPTAALLVEVLSPDDETFRTFDFFSAHGVEEVLVASPAERWVRCWHRTAEAYEQQAASLVLGVTMAELDAEVDWP